MPLINPYGVVIGQKMNVHRDDPDNFGKFYHVQLDVQTGNGSYHIAIDVDSHQSDTGVEWRIIELTTNDLPQVFSLANGWHQLQFNGTSGALDYVRLPFMKLGFKIKIPDLVKPDWWKIPPVLQLPQFLLFNKSMVWRNLSQPLRFFYNFIPFAPAFFWKRGNNLEAAEALESVLAQGDRVFVWGEHFTSGLGLHNVHQNQGDPIGGGHDAENGIWQDGATIIQRPNGTFVGFFNKFTSQSYFTDSFGKPI
jgi:hypothetical protein